MTTLTDFDLERVDTSLSLEDSLYNTLSTALGWINSYGERAFPWVGLYVQIDPGTGLRGPTVEADFLLRMQGVYYKGSDAPKLSAGKKTIFEPDEKDRGNLLTAVRDDLSAVFTSLGLNKRMMPTQVFATLDTKTGEASFSLLYSKAEGTFEQALDAWHGDLSSGKASAYETLMKPYLTVPPQRDLETL